MNEIKISNYLQCKYKLKMITSLLYYFHVCIERSKVLSRNPKNIKKNEKYKLHINLKKTSINPF